MCRRGYVALVTVGNTPNTDILCSNKAGSRFVHLQVKTFVPGTKTCSVGVKAETDFGPTFFWVLAGIPAPGSTAPFEYVIIPAAEMANNVAEYHKRWLATPGQKGQPRLDSGVRAVAVALGAPSYFWSVEAYRDRWELLGRELDA